MVNWTAYKFIEKIGVRGRFDSIDFSNKKSLTSIEEVLKNSRIAISTGSVNSVKAIRDPNLRASFFKTYTIEGKILEDEAEKGHISTQTPIVYLR